MPQQVRYAQQSQVINFQASSKQISELRRGTIYRELHLRLQGQVTLTAANNIPANMLPGDEWNSIQRITIKANNNDVLKTFQPQDLRWLDYLWYGVWPKKSLGTLGDGATANPSFDSTLVIPFWYPRSRKPFDTVLDSSELSSLRVEIDWNKDATSVNSQANATYAVAPTVTIHSLESYGVKGPFSTWRIRDIISNPGAAQVGFDVALTPGSIYRAFFVRMSVAGSITKFRIKSGTAIFMDAPFQLLNSVAMSFRRGMDINSELENNTLWRAGAPNDDSSLLFYYDHASDGMMSEAIDTLGYSEFLAEFDLANAATLTIYPMEIIPIRIPVGGGGQGMR